MSGSCGSKISSVIASCPTSRSVSLTVASARPRRPEVPRSGGTSASRSGGGGTGGNSRRVRRQRGWTGRCPKKRPNARSTQPLKSAPSAEWPVAGATTSVDCGNSCAVRSAFSTGVRRSSSPPSRSTGTSGSGPGPNSGGRRVRPALAEAERVAGSAVARSNGSNSESGTVGRPRAACRRRSAGSGGVVRAHGSGVSSQMVAAYSPELRRAAVVAAPSTSNARLRRRRSGVASPSSAARTAPGNPARNVGSKSPASRIENRSVRVRRRVRRPSAAGRSRAPAAVGAPTRSTSADRSATGSRVQGHAAAAERCSARGTAASVSR